MPTREEKIYYQDGKVKVTDLRITSNHITVPIDKIVNVSVDFKVATMTVSGTLLLSSIILLPFLCYYCGSCGWFGVLLVIAGLIWARMVYKTYTELNISAGKGNYKLLDASMHNREYIFKIEEALKLALAERGEI